MRARAAIAAIACAAGAACLLGSPADGATRSTAVGVAEREFTISLYRREVPPGLVRFNIQNFGEDAHNLVVLGRGSRPIASSAEIRAGRRLTLTARLRRRGSYRLVCTTADHAARGMKAKLVVRRPRRGH